MTEVTIQGEVGSFSHDAAMAWFGPRIEIRTCTTFPAVFEALAEGRAERAVVPVENTVVGPIREVVALLARAAARRAGEMRLRVDHCLIVARETPGGGGINGSNGRAGRAGQGIHRVASHPMALAQCAAFLRAHPGWEQVETLDTAGAVRALAEGRLAADAVIASRRAAERYGCRVLREAVQDEAVNFTTFVVLESRDRRLATRNRG